MSATSRAGGSQGQAMQPWCCVCSTHPHCFVAGAPVACERGINAVGSLGRRMAMGLAEMNG